MRGGEEGKRSEGGRGKGRWNGEEEEGGSESSQRGNLLTCKCSENCPTANRAAFLTTFSSSLVPNKEGHMSELPLKKTKKNFQ